MVTIYENQEEENTSESPLEIEENNTESGLTTTDEIKEVNRRDEMTNLDMVKPESTSKDKTMDLGEISDFTEKFISQFDERLKESEFSGGPTLRVSEVFGGLARVYERVRMAIEYKGEHVLRRTAIERILKRLVWEKESVRSNVESTKVTKMLIKELIWARYVKNGSVHQSKVVKLEKIVEKYIYFLQNIDNLPAGVSSSNVKSWLWGIASSEIEDLLEPTYRELFVQLMCNWFKDYFKWTDLTVDDHEKEIQIYLAVHRAFTKSDDPIMRYYLLLHEVPDWKEADREGIHKLIMKFPDIYSEIERHLEFKGRFALYRKVQRHAAAFEVFRDIAFNYKDELKDLLLHKKDFEETIRLVCDKKYRQIRQKVKTGIVRSIIYIFVTKVAFAMVIEIPYEILVYNNVLYTPLFINLMLPPFMMLFIGLTIKVPGAKNTEAIIDRLKSVIYVTESEPLPMSIEKARTNSTLALIFAGLYFFLFVIVFGTLTYVLSLLHFSPVGMLVFFAFLSLVTLFAFRVRFNATQLKIDSEQEGIAGHFSGYLTLPFLYIGSYLSQGLAKINFFGVILDFLIEVPLKNVIEIFEEWTGYLKEKKEEVVEMPE
jgi:hypothetical protein